jgi:small nuclear ribonucleoprotein (snRNP)-like protein
MSTRQLRLNTLEQIRSRLKDFSGKKINIVLQNGTVHFGELTSIDMTRLKFTNMRLQPVTVFLQDISEVYLDFKE